MTPSTVDLYGSFKEVRNKIRRHRNLDIVLRCIQNLPRITKVDPEELAKIPPWRLLLIIKWAIQEGNQHGPKLKPFEKSDFIKVLNLIQKFEHGNRFVETVQDLHLLMKTMAHQQFWMQQDFSFYIFCRQIYLFDRLGNTDFRDLFFASYGISSKDAIDLMFYTLINFITTDKVRISITKGFFSPIFSSISEETVERFLTMISKDIDGLTVYLKAMIISPRNIENELYELSPLVRFPLFRKGIDYLVFMPQLLVKRFEYFFYDFLCECDSPAARRRFADDFEILVGTSIAASGLMFTNANSYKVKFAYSGKNVDFIIRCNDATIMVEAKATVLHPVAKVSGNRDEVYRNTERTILKAIEQAQAHFEHIQNSQARVEWNANNDKRFLIVTTFSEIFLGNGIDYIRTVAPQVESELKIQYGDTLPLPLEHIYFVPIDDFEMMMTATKSGGLNLVAELEKAVNNDRSPSSKKFVLVQHFGDRFTKTNIPSYLTDELEELFERCGKRLPGYDQGSDDLHS